MKAIRLRRSVRQGECKGSFVNTKTTKELLVDRFIDIGHPDDDFDGFILSKLIVAEFYTSEGFNLSYIE